MIPLQFSTRVNIVSLHRQGVFKCLNLLTFFGDGWFIILFSTTKSQLLSKEVITTKRTKSKMN